MFLIGAGNETRTRDILLGKQTFYQLNYTRIDVACREGLEPPTNGFGDRRSAN